MENVFALDAIDFNTDTKQVLDRASQNLEEALKTAIAGSYLETTESTGELLRLTSVGYNVDTEKTMVDRMFIYGPKHAFVLHHGVATVAKSKKGKRKNYQLHIKETNHIAIAMEQSNFIENLANDLAELRANQIAQAFNYLD